MIPTLHKTCVHPYDGPATLSTNGSSYKLLYGVDIMSVGPK